VGERQLELGDVGDLRAGLLRSAGAQGAGLLAGADHRRRWIFMLAVT
jgi:hypothetical protein